MVSNHLFVESMYENERREVGELNRRSEGMTFTRWNLLEMRLRVWKIGQVAVECFLVLV